MPLQIVRDGPERMRVDAVVNPLDSLLSRARAALGGLKAGESKLIGVGRGKARYVIRTHTPFWRGGQRGERELLAACYRSALRLAKDRGCASVAFPLLSTGLFGFPKAIAMRVAAEAITAFLAANDLTVFLAMRGGESDVLSEALYRDIAAYIDQNHIPAHQDGRCLDNIEPQRVTARDDDSLFEYQACDAAMEPESAQLLEADEPTAPASRFERKATLEALINAPAESFSEMLLRLIDEKGLTDAQCYKRANLDRKLFSKIRSNARYQPSKPTVIALGLALELPMPKLNQLLRSAGFALSPASRSDVIISYFVERGQYNLFEVNEALFAFDEEALGA